MFDLNLSGDRSFHKRAAHLDLTHHLLGNGQIQAIVQVTENKVACNAISLHLMNPDRLRQKTESFTFHRVLGPELTGVALFYNNHLYFPNPRQTSFDLKYGLVFDDGVPMFRAMYPAEFTIRGDRIKTPFNVEESIFCTNAHKAVLRRVRVTNRRGLEGESVRLFSFLIPNETLFPEAHFVTSDQVAVSGNYRDGDEFLGLAALNPIDNHMVAEFPVPFEAAVGGGLGTPGPSCDDEVFVRPQGNTMDWLLPDDPAYLGAVMALEFNLGELTPLGSEEINLVYAYGHTENDVLRTIDAVRQTGFEGQRESVRNYWQGCNLLQTGQQNLDDYYQAVRAGIRASVAHTGKMDSTLWGYNSESVHDSSLQCVGAVLSGQFETARAMLDHMVGNLLDAKGMFAHRTQFNDPKRAMLDQNGWFLFALWLYWVQSGDEKIIRQYWEEIQTIAEFPIRPEFWVEEASMVKSCRDWKERDELFGLEEGFELAFQLWVSIGLNKASDMAHFIGNEQLADRWKEIGKRIWDAVLHHPKFNFIENDHFMRRRLPDGTFQRKIEKLPYFAMPMRVEDPSDLRMFPKQRQGSLEPDPGEAWPIARGMVDPESELSRRTLARLEALWNQEWDFGGYPLQTADSEPIVLGSWPMALNIITQAATEARQYDIVRRNIDFMLTTKDGRGYTWWEYRDADPNQQIDYGFDVNFDYGDPVLLFVYHILGYRPGIEAIHFVPHLLPELEEVYARLRFRDYWIELHLYNHGRFISKVKVSGEEGSEFTGDQVRIDIPSKDISVEIWLSDDH